MQLAKQNRHNQGNQAEWTSTSLPGPRQRKVVLLLRDSWGQGWRGKSQWSQLLWGGDATQPRLRAGLDRELPTCHPWYLGSSKGRARTSHGRKIINNENSQDTAEWGARRAGYTSDPVGVPALEASLQGNPERG